MGKLSLEALKERAEATASTELLATISGGTENACHDGNVITKTLKAKSDSELHIVQTIWNWLFN
jgi:hypothetical protein